jgi:hypothetical protein
MACSGGRQARHAQAHKHSAARQAPPAAPASGAWCRCPGPAPAACVCLASTTASSSESPRVGREVVCPMGVLTCSHRRAGRQHRRGEGASQANRRQQPAGSCCCCCPHTQPASSSRNSAAHLSPALNTYWLPAAHSAPRRPQSLKWLRQTAPEPAGRAPGFGEAPETTSPLLRSALNGLLRASHCRTAPLHEPSARVWAAPARLAQLLALGARLLPVPAACAACRQQAAGGRWAVLRPQARAAAPPAAQENTQKHARRPQPGMRPACPPAGTFCWPRTPARPPSSPRARPPA